jgi:hypothetical protein
MMLGELYGLGDDAAGAPTGSVLLYQGVWQVTPTLNVNTIVSRVSQSVRMYGLQVTNSQNDGGAFTLGNFNVTLLLQVTGGGYALPSDAGAMVDHAYYSVVGSMPVSSSAFLQSAGGAYGGGVPPNVPGGSGAPPPDLTTWLTSNAWWIALLGAAVVVLPKIL